MISYKEEQARFKPEIFGAEHIIKNGQFNIGYICTELQCELGRKDKTAVVLITHSGTRKTFSYLDINVESNKFANVLKKLGFSTQDVFFTFLGRSMEQYISFLGSLKMQAITGTLFANFGEEAILDRLGDSKARGVITKKSLMKRILKVRDKLPDLKYIILTDVDDNISEDILSYKKIMSEASPEFETPLTTPQTPSVLHYTSGSTGKPKGVLHVHGAVLFQHYTSSKVLSLKEDDIYWCTADPGWVTGTSYGIIGPFSIGVTQLAYEGGYKVQKWFDIIGTEEITVWYTAPTALRMLMQEEQEIFRNANLDRLKYIFSVGEPLNPEIVRWGKSTFDRDIHDTYFQTETGAIMLTNRPGLQIKAGSMGKPLETLEAQIISDEGNILEAGKTGNLAIKAGWPSMFSIYLNNKSTYDSKFKNGFYFTGDLAYKDQEGYFWFIGRNDDIINTAGHLISPFEIESALLEFDEIAEAAAIGAPDDILFEKVVVFVKLHEQYSYSREIELKIKLFLANRVSSIATPQEMIFTNNIPKNKSGKIMRRVLKAQYLGQDPGDISTLED